MFYVHYKDDGPSGPCGQDIRSTSPKNRLYVFRDRAAAEPMILRVNERKTGGRNPRIENSWDDYDGADDWEVVYIT